MTQPRADAVEVVERVLAEAVCSEDGPFIVNLSYRWRIRLARLIVQELCRTELLAAR